MAICIRYFTTRNGDDRTAVKLKQNLALTAESASPNQSNSLPNFFTHSLQCKYKKNQ